MRILIDGIVFDKGYAALPAAKFWADMIPRLVERLRGVEIFFLNRGSAVQFQEVASIQHLYAPSVNSSIAAVEFNRIAALCAEYGVATFLSTYGTSAGGQVKSLFVDPLKGLLNMPKAEENSYKYAAQLAVTRLAVHEDGLKRITHLAGVPEEKIICLYSGEKVVVSPTVIANWLAKQLLQLSVMECKKLDYFSLTAQKEISNEYSSNSHVVYDAAGWNNYLGYLNYVQQSKQNQQ